MEYIYFLCCIICVLWRLQIFTCWNAHQPPCILFAHKAISLRIVYSVSLFYNIFWKNWKAVCQTYCDVMIFLQVKVTFNLQVFLTRDTTIFQLIVQVWLSLKWWLGSSLSILRPVNHMKYISCFTSKFGNNEFILQKPRYTLMKYQEQ